MSSAPLIIIGAGGHAKVVAATAQACGRKILAILDDDSRKWNQKVLGLNITGPLSEIKNFTGAEVVLAIGDNRLRKKLVKDLKADWATLVHPTAIVHSSVRIGGGSVVFAGAILQPDTWLGEHTILNTGCRVDHDCRVGDFAHLGPAAALAGDVVVGEGVLVGIGVSVRPQTRLGDWSVIGAGSAVVKDIGASKTFVGVPAKLLSEKE